PSQMSAVASALWAEPSSELVTAQAMPLPSTSVSHIGPPRPPFGVPAGDTTLRNAPFRLASVRPAAASSVHVSAWAVPSERPTAIARAAGLQLLFFILVLLGVWVLDADGRSAGRRG